MNRSVILVQVRLKNWQRWGWHPGVRCNESSSSLLMKGSRVEPPLRWVPTARAVGFFVEAKILILRAKTASALNVGQGLSGYIGDLQ